MADAEKQALLAELRGYFGDGSLVSAAGDENQVAQQRTSSSGDFSAVLETVLDSTTMRVVDAVGQITWSASKPVGQVLWLGDSCVFTEVDRRGRADAVVEIDPSAEQPIPQTIVNEPDANRYLSLSRTSDDKKLRIESTDRESNRLWLYAPDSGQLELMADYAGVRTDVDVDGEHSVMSHRSATNTRWQWRGGEDETWIDITSACPKDFRWFRVVRGWLVVAGPLASELLLEAVQLDSRRTRRVLSKGGARARGVVTAVWPSESGWLNVNVAQLDRPDVVFGWHPERRAASSPSESSSGLREARLEAIADDGAHIPISMLWRNDLSHEPSPTLLLSYGCYGFAFDPEYAAVREPLLRRGFRVGIVHLRGGGDNGHRWHLGGRGPSKLVSVTDLITAVDHLHATGLASRERTILRSSSAGAAVTVAALHRRPDLAAGAVLDRPHLDVQDAWGQRPFLTSFDFPEWGVRPDDRTTIAAWTPAETVPRDRLPPMLFRTGDEDGRVAVDEYDRYVRMLDGWKVPHQAERVWVRGQHSRRTTGAAEEAEDLAATFCWILDQVGGPEGGHGPNGS